MHAARAMAGLTAGVRVDLFRRCTLDSLESTGGEERGEGVVVAVVGLAAGKADSWWGEGIREGHTAASGYGRKLSCCGTSATPEGSAVAQWAGRRVGEFGI